MRRKDGPMQGQVFLHKTKLESARMTQNFFDDIELIVFAFVLGHLLLSVIKPVKSEFAQFSKTK